MESGKIKTNCFVKNAVHVNVCYTNFLPITHKTKIVKRVGDNVSHILKITVSCWGDSLSLTVWKTNIYTGGQSLEFLWESGSHRQGVPDPSVVFYNCHNFNYHWKQSVWREWQNSWITSHQHTRVHIHTHTVWTCQERRCVPVLAVGHWSGHTLCPSPSRTQADEQLHQKHARGSKRHLNLWFSRPGSDSLHMVCEVNDGHHLRRIWPGRYQVPSPLKEGMRSHSREG